MSSSPQEAIFNLRVSSVLHKVPHSCEKYAEFAVLGLNRQATCRENKYQSNANFEGEDGNETWHTGRAPRHQ